MRLRKCRNPSTIAMRFNDPHFPHFNQLLACKVISRWLSSLFVVNNHAEELWSSRAAPSTSTTDGRLVCSRSCHIPSTLWIRIIVVAPSLINAAGACR